MAGYGKNSDLIGAVILLLLLSGHQGGVLPGKLFSPGAMGLSDLIGSLRLDHFARDMHRLVDMMDQMANLGQMSGLLRSSGISALLPPPDRSHVSGAANAVSGSVTNALSNAASVLPPDGKLPDIQQLMELAGPLMAMLSSQNGDYSK